MVSGGVSPELASTKVMSESFAILRDKYPLLAVYQGFQGLLALVSTMRSSIPEDLQRSFASMPVHAFVTPREIPLISRGEVGLALGSVSGGLTTLPPQTQLSTRGHSHTDEKLDSLTFIFCTSGISG
jgi:hypothetical protein